MAMFRISKYKKEPPVRIDDDPRDELPTDCSSDRTELVSPEISEKGDSQIIPKSDTPVGSFMQSTPRTCRDFYSPPAIENVMEFSAKCEDDSPEKSFCLPKIIAWQNKDETEMKIKNEVSTLPLEDVVTLKDVIDLGINSPRNQNTKKLPSPRSPKKQRILSQKQKNEEWIEEDIV